MTNIGVPQGSVLGPTLWNVMYDDLLELEMEERVSLTGYADDVAITVQDRDWERTKEKMGDALEQVRNWLGENGLQIAPETTELVTLKYGRRRREGAVEIAGHDVQIAQTAKYLGIILDTSVSYGPHIRAAAAKADKAISSLIRLMPNIGGPREARRRILSAVANSIVLYGAPIWAGSMNVATYRIILQGVQRKLALRVCRTYRTTSFVAVMVISAMVPIHLLARERIRLWGREEKTAAIRREEREATVREWQREWNSSIKGRWTHRLIPNIGPWLNRSVGETDYYVTQFLTGHRSFKSYLKKIGKAEDDICNTQYCIAGDGTTKDMR